MASTLVGGALPVSALDVLAIVAAIYLVARLVGFLATRLLGRPKPKSA